MIDLSIIIVSWNVADLLAACLDSVIQTQGDLQIEIVVVDSASSDHTATMVKRRYPQVTLIEQTENVGFVRGNNLGFQQSKGRHLLLLNPDTEVIGDALAQMVRHLDENPDVGIVGPHTLNADGTTQSTRRRFPTVITGVFESTWLQPYAPKTILDHYYIADQSDTATLDVDWVQGSALMARREVYARIGGLDEGFVMYSEEMDWCKRARDAGWRVVYLGSAQIIHHGGKSSEQVVVRRQIHFQESKLRYFRKHYGWWAANFLRAVLLGMYAWQLLLEAAKGLAGHKRDLRRERVRQYWQVLRSGLKGN